MANDNERRKENTKHLIIPSQLKVCEGGNPLYTLFTLSITLKRCKDEDRNRNRRFAAAATI